LIAFSARAGIAHLVQIVGMGRGLPTVTSIPFLFQSQANLFTGFYQLSRAREIVHQLEKFSENDMKIDRGNE